MGKLRKQLKLLSDTLDGLSAFLDVAHIQIAERRCHLKVTYPTWINSQQTATSSIRSDWIVRK